VPENLQSTLTVAVTMRREEENVLRRLIGGFAWLEGLCADSVAFPESEDDFQRIATDLPPLRCRLISLGARTREGNWVAKGEWLAPSLSFLVEQAQNLGYSFAYQAIIAPLAHDADLLRSVGRNLIGLRREPGASQKLIAEHSRTK
jgi:hypothetical protein